MTPTDFYRWFLRVLLDALARLNPAPQAEDADVITPSPDRQALDTPTGAVATPGQSNLTPRPQQPVITAVAEHSTTLLGDGKRFTQPRLPTPAGAPVIPLVYYPLDPPAPPRVPDSQLYDPELGAWRTWGDPKRRLGATYGEDGPSLTELPFLTDEPGTNVSIPFGGQVIDGVRSFYSLAIPWIMNSTGGFPTGGVAYPNLPATFAGVPQAIVGSTVVCSAAYSAYSGGPVVPSGPRYYLPESYNEVVSTAVVVATAAEVAPAATGFTAPVPTVRADAAVDNTPPDPHTLLYTHFVWYPPEDGEVHGTLNINWRAVVYGDLSSMNSYAVNERNSSATFPPTPEDSFPYHLFKWSELVTAGTQNIHGFIGRHPRPADAEWGEVLVAAISPSPTFGSGWTEFKATRVFDGSGVFGRIALHSVITAERGEPIYYGNDPLNNPLPADCVIGAFIRAFPGTPFAFRAYHVRPVSPPPTLSSLSLDQQKALAAAVPVMYRGEFGTIPRPYATHEGSFCGIPYAVTESRFVSCDALKAGDGATLGVVFEGNEDGTDAMLRVSRRPAAGGEFELLWTGAIDGIAPAENRVGEPSNVFGPSALAPSGHQQFDHPQWPFTVALINARGVGGGSSAFWVRERQVFETWTDCPVVLVGEA